MAAHLWQSTWFAGAAWLATLATLALRRNRAEARYWVWFAASAKFLIPFSCLMELGSWMPHRAAVTTGGPGWVAAMEEFSQPLALSASGVPAGAPDHRYFGTAAAALWACGFAVVAIVWLLRWRRQDDEAGLSECHDGHAGEFAIGDGSGAAGDG